jgi:pilus assembly protein Flp/PilA
MLPRFWNLIFRARTLMGEDGQDLVEYALLIALIAFAATAGMSSLASSINSIFVAVGGKMTIA